MKWNPNTFVLYTRESMPIAQVDCAEHLDWDGLTPLPNRPHTRQCPGCSRLVIDTKELDDTKALAIKAYDPSVCFHVSSTYKHIDMHTDEDKEELSVHEANLLYHFRTAQTARTVDAIDKAAKANRHLVHVPVQQPESEREWPEGHKETLTLWQHKQSGEVSLQMHPRYMQWKGQLQDWTLIHTATHHPFLYFPERIAAYVLPRRMKAGQYVLLTDLIEHYIHPELSREYGAPIRRTQAIAQWDGNALHIHLPENEKMTLHNTGWP